MSRSRFVSLATVVATALALAAGAGPAPRAQATPNLRISTVVSGLTVPWDLTWVGDLLLYDLRAGQVWSKRGAAAPRQVAISGFPSIFAVGEGGLLGMVADPAATSNKRFYTCQAVRSSSGGALDVRVLRWRLTSDTTAVSDGAPVVTGIPLSSGRHSGCRLRFGTDGLLYVGTGDAAVGTHPQNKASLGGKILRVRWDGGIPADNPFVGLGGNARYVWNYGHRNIQGLAQRPGTDELWSVEHGSDRDDEVNLVVKGANYGWDPVPGYNETRPMTDLGKFPTATSAMWSSGLPTVATSGAAFLTDRRWGAWRGSLAVALLKDQGISLMRMDPTPGPTRVVATTRLPQAEGLGRIRALMQGPDGALWLTTSNGGGNDRIVRISPATNTPALVGGRLVQESGVALARTGTEVSAFVRSTGDQVVLRRSTNDGASWSGALATGVTTTNAPSAASSASGRVDLVTRTGSGSVLHSWFQAGTRLGSTDLGGSVVAQHVASLGDGTLDVFAVTPAGGAVRRHFDGSSWGAWVAVGGTFTSGLSASADPARHIITVSGRGTDGGTFEREFTPTAALGGWAARTDGLSTWSGRALGDTWPGVARLAVGTGADAAVVVQRGSTAIATTMRWTSAGDIVTRADGSYLLAGRGTDGALWVTDGGPGGYGNRSLGGVVR
ncbi:PQQ-dependent sugar dehydrogenase [Oryzobacter telluris]|uniref:PQQ-dependent sugar dehydrogenase n=1 Tax=Oryzobacter telluris TaxID=3149179 RepID=UPI00370D73F6